MVVFLTFLCAWECHRASIRHLGCMDELAYARICGPVSMR